LDAVIFTIPSRQQHSCQREKYLIALYCQPQGGMAAGLWGVVALIRMLTGWRMHALSPYQSRSDVAAAIDKALMVASF
jgi:hypothetical protein